MINRTSFLVTSLAAVLVLAGCGDKAVTPGASGSPDASSLEPVDAVPLPLDDIIVAPVPVTAPVQKVEAKDAEAERPAETATPATVTATSTGETSATPPRVAVEPREPSPALARPEKPATPPTDPQKPVLNF